jgi:hypothetical protein
MLIDRSGLTLDVLATNIFRYPQANFGDWGASIDTFNVRIVSNNFDQGRMSGQIKVPISDSSLVYSAVLRDSTGGVRFEFSIRPRGTLNIPLWVASMELDNTSWVRLQAGGGRGFIAQANFTGQISLGGTRDIPMRMGGIRFQDMRIQTHEQPYISVRTWSFASPPHSILGPPEPEPVPDGGGSSSRSAGGFPISIREISLVSGPRGEGPGVGVRIGIDVNLQGGSAGISGGTTISVWGAFRTGSGGPPSFVFSGIDLDSIGVRADLGAVDIEGSVRFYNNDPTYGNGFRGGVRANFVRMVMVEATVQFGSINGPPAYRYWYVDARAIISRGIPIFSGVGIYGFGGGAWYNMRRTSNPSDVTPTSAGGTTTTASGGNPGTTNSGARYVPYYSSSGETFGFYALVTLGTHPEPKAFNCDVRLEVSFVGGGINEIRLEGNGWMMAGLTERSNAPVRMTASISYTFPTRTFHGEFGITANLSVVSATGRMVLHFAPDLWYLKIGDPDGERVQIRVMDFLTVQAYFAAGMDLPTPRIPAAVLALTGSLPTPVRPEALGRGNGFVFGAMADFNPGELRFLVFYASMRFLIGFDLSLLDYGATARCSDGRPLGANGWYATGQLYARIDASIGLFVDLWFVSGKFEILGFRVGAALQAGLPNPTWLAGAVGGQYSILGGLIRGNCNFQFTIGDRCTPVRESAVASVEMISDIVPDDGSSGVSLFAEPTAFFNYEPERPFTLEELRDDGSTRTRTFRIKVGSFTLRERKMAGRYVSVPVSGPNMRRYGTTPAAVITPNQSLDPLTVYKATVTAYAQETTDNGRTWQDVRYVTGERRGQRVEQQVSTQFTTQNRPDTVVPDWVYIAYPRPMQRFFLQDECRDGSITLLTNPTWLFPSSGSQRRVGDTLQYFRVRFINLSTLERVEVPLEYRSIERPYYDGEPRRSSRILGGRIGFTIPRLANETIYAVQVIRRDSIVPSATTSLAIGRYLQGIVRTALYQRDSNTITINSQYRPSGFDVARVVASNEKLLYLYFFRTSRYNRMANKVRGLRTVRADSVVALFFPVISTELSSPEGFDPNDVRAQEVNLSVDGTEQNSRPYTIRPLIRISAQRRVDWWHTAYVNPYVYDEIQWLYDAVARRGGRRYQTVWNETILRGEPMFDVTRPSHDKLYDYEIASAPGGRDMMWIFTRLSIRFSGGRPTESGTLSVERRPLVTPETRGLYAQPSYVSLDIGRARPAATWLLSQSGLSTSEIARLRRIASHSFVFPYRGRQYTIDFQYIGCPYDPDLGPPTEPYQFQY